MEDIFTPEQVDLLERFADGLVPLASWITQKHYIPELNPSWIETIPGVPSSKAPPWRGERLGVRDIGLVKALEALIRSSSSATDLVVRWEHRRDSPMEHFPHRGADHWRQSRGLQRDAKFAIYESGNVFLDKTGTPLIRIDFYRRYLPYLQTCVAGANPSSDDAWRGLAKDLSLDKSTFWPANSPASSILVRQFLRDCVAVLLGMQNLPFVRESIYAYAVLIELGEMRRKGNAFTEEHVKTTVRLLEKVLEGVKP